MKQVNFGQLKDQANAVLNQVSLDDAVPKEEIRFVGGFDVSYDGEDCVCAAVVFDLKDNKIVEKKVVRSKTPMKFVPGFLAFREGPVMCEAYYSLENEPDVLMVDGNGLADDGACGTASFIGVELAKPSIGVAKRLAAGVEKDGFIFIGEQKIGKVVKTKEFANPLFVSVGNMVSVETAAELVLKCVIPPHKMPEPIHVAHRVADKKIKNKDEVVLEQFHEI